MLEVKNMYSLINYLRPVVHPRELCEEATVVMEVYILHVLI